MIASLASHCTGDQGSTASMSSGRLHIDPAFLGCWDSTNTQTLGIRRVQISTRGEQVLLHAYGADGEDVCDWGEVELDLLADQVDTTVATKFRTTYDFGFMEVHIHAWVKLGVLVFGIFNRFKDESGRSNYFDREFFALQPT